MEQRKLLLETEGRIALDVTINIDDFLADTVAINEDTGELYWVNYQPMLDTLTLFDAVVSDLEMAEPKLLAERTPYFRSWAALKGEEATINRIAGFYDLYQWIKKDGLKTPVAVEVTGQKLDGSHRAAIMKHLGHKTIPAKLYRFAYNEIDEDFLKRTTRAREMVFGPNYYALDYGSFRNIEAHLPTTYFENTKKWDVLKDIIQPDDKYILDIGCNEGWITVNCALTARHVVGVDHEFIEGAEFHRLIMEFYEQRKLPVTFLEQDITVQQHLPKYDVALLLCVLYHIPREKQIPLLIWLKDRVERLVVQCNENKSHEVDHFYGCTVESAIDLLNKAGWKVDTTILHWGAKPIITAHL